jgi:HNH endonuclease
VLARDPVCKRCGEAPSVIADHVKPLRQGGGWELSNGAGMCRRCDGIKGFGERFGNKDGGASYLLSRPPQPDKRQADFSMYRMEDS